jgi:thiamine biosynthesis protein ThiS
MQITVNGAATQPSDGSTISDILATRTLQEDVVIVLLNGEIARRELWANTTLKAGDRVEIVHVLGGG